MLILHFNFTLLLLFCLPPSLPSPPTCLFSHRASQPRFVQRPHTTFSISNLLISPLSALISLLCCSNPPAHVSNEPSSTFARLFPSSVLPLISTLESDVIVIFRITFKCTLAQSEATLEHANWRRSAKHEIRKWCQGRSIGDLAVCLLEGFLPVLSAWSHP